MLVNNALTTLNIYYYMPDHRHLVQMYLWQQMDLAPKFPKVHKFLNFWHDNIEAVIAEVELAHAMLTDNKFVNGKELIKW